MTPPSGSATATGRYRFAEVVRRSLTLLGRQVPLPQFLILIPIAVAPNLISRKIASTLTMSSEPYAPMIALQWWALLALWFLLQLLVQSFVIQLSVQAMQEGRLPIGIDLQRFARRLIPLIGTLLVAFVTVVVAIFVWIAALGVVWSLISVVVHIPDLPESFTGLIIGLAVDSIPALILAVRMAVVIPACLCEKLGPFAALQRSARLTKGSRLAIFVSYLALYPVAFIVGKLWVWISLIVGGSDFVAYLAAPVEALIIIFIGIFHASLYCELREAKEGRGPDRLAEIFS